MRGATCPRCLGCLTCQTYAAGCLCSSVEYSAERVAARQAWLDAGRALGAHIDDCFPCALPWATDCEDGQALRVAVDAAWERFDAEGVGTGHVTRAQRRYEETGR